MPSSHLFHLDATQPQNSSASGSRTDATKKELSVLRGMSLSLLRLQPKGVREPHWHPNAHELSYCLEGRALMTIFSPGFTHDTLLIEPGTLAFVPMGSLHHIENIGDSPLKMLVCFNHEQPEDINLSSSVFVMPKEVLAKTFHLDPSFFAGLHDALKPVFIYEKAEATKPELAWTTNRFKMNLDASHPQVQTRGGWVKMSNSFLMPSLEGLALYNLLLNVQGLREPHWHPNAHELNYLISGQARITLLSPGGHVDTFDMQAGDMSFLPQGYFHHIENTGAAPAHFAVFFNHETPSDIGLSGSLGAYSNDTLAALFKVPSSYFDPLPKYQEDLFIVPGGG